MPDIPSLSMVNNDKEEYMKMFFELIVNTICHRNYSITEVESGLVLDDRYEIEVPEDCRILLLLK